MAYTDADLQADLAILKNNPQTGLVVRQAIARISEAMINSSTDQIELFNDLLNEYTENGNGSQTTAEIVAARSGEVNLKARLDKEQQDVNAQLAQKAIKGEIGLADLNKNVTQFDETWFTDEVKKQWAGDTPISAVPADGSTTTNKLADGSVVVSKLESYLKNAMTSDYYTEFELNGLGGETGVPQLDPKRLRTINFHDTQGKRVLFNGGATIQYAVQSFSKDLVFIKNSGWLTTKEYDIPDTGYFKLLLRFADNRNILESDYATLKSTLKTIITIDKKIAFDLKSLASRTLPKLEGLKWGIVGDSISTVGYKGDGMEYPKQIADRNNMILNNLAIPGSMIAKTSSASHLTDHMCEMVLQLDADCDMVTVAGAVNDARNNVPLGSFGDTDITTFYGALETLCINLITRFPNTPKCVFTPIQHRGNNAKLVKYVDAILEVVGGKYGIPVFDNFRRSDLHPDIDFINNNYFYDTGNGTGDGLHPNGEGQTILARRNENCMLQIV